MARLRRVSAKSSVLVTWTWLDTASKPLRCTCESWMPVPYSPRGWSLPIFISKSQPFPSHVSRSTRRSALATSCRRTSTHWSAASLGCAAHSRASHTSHFPRGDAGAAETATATRAAPSHPAPATPGSRLLHKPSRRSLRRAVWRNPKSLPTASLLVASERIRAARQHST